MKRFLLPHLICPACLPKEQPLRLTSACEEEGDITSGLLSCNRCSQRFPIKNGIAHLLPEPERGVSGGQWRYDEPDLADRYLWSHYGEILGVPEFGDANMQWANLLSFQATDLSFDAGCSVGRLTFEMSARSALAVGCDLSGNFIRIARRLARDRRLTFSLQLEGNLRETFQIELPESWRSDNIEFIVADALRIPFASETFGQVASLNILDRVSYPLAHLFEINRVARNQDASFLFGDPFSWSVSSAPEELWLGGTVTGPYKGRGLDNVRRLLEGKEKILAPPWRINNTGAVSWKMRTHRNHYEVIRSDFLVAER